MHQDQAATLLTRMRRRLLRWRIDREIFRRILPHLRGEKDHGYPFLTNEEMNSQTAERDVQTLLDTIQCQVHRMPKAYGESFLHIMHRDLHERLRMYQIVAERRVKPDSIEPKFVAVRA